jgi:hypothetical protein
MQDQECNLLRAYGSTAIDILARSKFSFLNVTNLIKRQCLILCSDRSKTAKHFQEPGPFENLTDFFGRVCSMVDGNPLHKSVGAQVTI